MIRTGDQNREGATDSRVCTDSLDELAALVVDEYSGVADTGSPRPTFPAPPITAREDGTEISYRTIKDAPQIRIEYGLPDLTHFIDTKVSHEIPTYGRMAD